MQPTTVPSASSQHVEIVSFHSPEGRETEARFRISEGTLSLAPFAHDQPLALFGAEIEFRHSSDFDRLLIWRFNGSDVLPRFLMSDTRQLHSLGGGGLLARVLARGQGGNMSAPQGECESAPCLIAGRRWRFRRDFDEMFWQRGESSLRREQWQLLARTLGREFCASPVFK